MKGLLLWLSAMTSTDSLAEATFGGGCFWCTEALFKMLNGVVEVFPGYAGGHVPNPTYEAVCTQTTGHAEVVRVRFRPEAISYETLVEYFFLTHDPTTPNRQGNDVGPQYRSVIFYHTPEQKAIAEKVKARLEAQKVFDKPIVTAIEPLHNFYPAEKYHWDYYARNPEKPYCTFVIAPKLQKARAKFQALLKPEGR
ncbi:MAG: peptide-methionine (S)-S-oxide reductase MsrA [Bacteroidia bacterium]